MPAPLAHVHIFWYVPLGANRMVIIMANIEKFGIGHHNI